MILGLDVSSSKIGYSIIDQNKNLIECKFKKFKPKEELENRARSGKNHEKIYVEFCDRMGEKYGVKRENLVIDDETGVIHDIKKATK